MKNTWIPLTSYYSDCDTYLLMAKRKKNGIIKFKNKKVSKYVNLHILCLKIEDQFKQLFLEENIINAK